MRLRIAMVVMLVVAGAPFVGAGEGEAGVPFCFGMPPDIVVSAPGLVTYGTPGDDVILGTAGVDVIDGEGGNDRICGLDGSDQIEGDSGNDRIDGGGGNDDLYGDGGNDLIRGGGGDDNLSGWFGDDTLNGGPGNDQLWGGPGNDLLAGKGGRDWLLYSGGADVNKGGNGKDWYDASGLGGSPPGLTIDLDAQVYSGSAGNYGPLIGVENVKGSALADVISASPVVANKIKAGGGNDEVTLARSGDLGVGNGGNDVLVSGAAFTVLRGKSGKDRVVAHYRSTADGGMGNDRCRIGPGSTPIDCENHTLLCPGTGDPIHGGATSISTATGDFDGNGKGGTLTVYQAAGSWWAHIQTDKGFGARVALPASVPGLSNIRAIGAHDIQKDTIEEAFIVSNDGGAYTEIVGIYTFFQPEGSPATGLTCGVEPLTFSGSSARAEFPVGASVMNASGLACTPLGIDGISQSTGDGTNYTNTRTSYGYTPGFGNAQPELVFAGSNTQSLIRPGDDSVIDAAGQLWCGGLSL